MRWLVLLVALVACGKHAAEAPMQLDRTSVYPVVVPTGYLPTGPVRKPLIEGLEVALVEHHDAPGSGGVAGLARYLRPQDLDGLTIDDAYKLGLANLEAAGKRQAIPIQGRGSASGVDLLVFGQDWRAASAVLLPGVAQMAHAQLGDGPLLALIPHRDVLVVLRDDAGRDATVKKVLEIEAGNRKPITNRVLRLVGSDQPFWVKPPIAWAD